MRLIAVTGTKGKTTVCWLIKSILEKAGRKVGMLGSAKYCLGDGRDLPAGLTTPARVDTNNYVALMRSNGCDWAVVEASSHGIHQGRLTDLDFDIAVCTNIRPEHLEYHKTYEEYRRVKASLFAGLRADAVAILNADDPDSFGLAADTKAQVWNFGTCLPKCWAEVESAALDHTILNFGIGEKVAQNVWTDIVGPWGISNIMAAAAAAVTAGADWYSVAAGVSWKASPPGRMQWVPMPPQLGFRVVVDNAHTPESLRNVLCYLRSFCRGRLIAVVGTMGDRYPEKRPLLGRISETIADIVVVTTSDPRSEDPKKIVGGILGGMRTPDTAMARPDRHSVLKEVAAMAKPGDIVAVISWSPNSGLGDPPVDLKIVKEHLWPES